MARSTPWGSSQNITTFFKGFSFVDTAGHGGIMISKSVANKYLSDAAKNSALVHNGYYCYEEDVDFLIPLVDSALLLSAFYKKASDQELLVIREKAIKDLSGVAPGFLIAIGEAVDEKEYGEWKLRQKYSEALNKKDKNCIVSTFGEEELLIENVFCFQTADGRKHGVHKDAYFKKRCDDQWAIYPTIDGFDLIDIASYGSLKERAEKYIKNKANYYAKKLGEWDESGFGPRQYFNQAINLAGDSYCDNRTNDGDVIWRTASTEFEKLLVGIFKDIPDTMKCVDALYKARQIKKAA
ncbi:hypothetical protein A3715_15905 [Oleiphilus sp. HI0009]|nr:hypothetical protein A3715_15905 [Oleiphilus sp. HI0009]